MQCLGKKRNILKMVPISKKQFYAKDMVGNNVDLKNAGCTWDEDFAYWKLASKDGYKHDEDVFSYNISRLFNTHPMIKVAPHEPKDPFIWKLGMKHKIQLSVAVVTQPK